MGPTRAGRAAKQIGPPDREVFQRTAHPAEKGGQADLGKKGRGCDADLGVGGAHRHLALQHVGAPLQQLRRDPGGHFRRHSLFQQGALVPACIRLVQSRLKRPRVDLEQQIALADKRAFPVRLADQIAHHLSADLGIYVAVESADPFLDNRDVASLDERHLDFHGPGRSAHRLSLATARQQDRNCRREQSAKAAGRRPESDLRLRGRSRSWPYNWMAGLHERS